MTVLSSMSDGLRRARFREGKLRRISAASMVSDSPSGHESCEWLPQIQLGSRSHEALRCRAGSRVTYDVTLPSNASVAAWCALDPVHADRRGVAVEFEIRVKSTQAEASARCAIASDTPPRWRLLSTRALAAGPARIELVTRIVDRGSSGELKALWGDPAIRAPRTLANLTSAIRAVVSQQGLRGVWHKALTSNDDRLYSLWVREHEPSKSELRAQREWSAGRARLFTLITVVPDPAGWQPDRTIPSVLEQTYPRWEWILLTSMASTADLERSAARVTRDPRIRLLGVDSRSPRADAWNDALRASRGEFACLLGERDALSASALYDMARALEASPAADVLYSDEDRLASGTLQRCNPRFKPDWSPDLLLSENYIGRLAMIRVATAKAAGEFQDTEWELFLRLSRLGAVFQRVPRCLYHADQKISARAGENIADPILRSHLEGLGLHARAGSTNKVSRLSWDVEGRPIVSIVIPNRNAATVLGKCLAGLTEQTGYPHREVIVVDNGSTDADVLELYDSLERRGLGRIVRFDRPFNFSAACNAGAAAARGDLLLFLNNDIEVIEPDWLEELIRWAQRPAIGIVGAQLLYPDRRIQHAGVVFGIGLVGHIFAGAAPSVTGVFGSPESYRNYLAVTGACQMMRRNVFERLGGYDERFRLSFSDVVFCMEAWKAGLRVVYTPHARLVHHESYTRKREDSPEDMELLARYLKKTGFVEDPYFHPELDGRSPVPAVRPPLDPMPRQIISDYVDRVLAAAAI
jgi:GT2 family glycosyltransferase